MGTNLKFVKINQIDQIPRYLFEQVKPREFDIDRLYKWGPILIDNPVNIMGAFLDKEELVKGVMWLTYNPITNKITVHILSIDKEYQGKGILKEVKGILKKISKNVDADGIIAFTTRPKAIERTMGWKRSQFIQMET